MLHPATEWIRRAVDEGVLRGGGGAALIAYGVIHSLEIFSFLRFRITCGGLFTGNVYVEGNVIAHAVKFEQETSMGREIPFADFDFKARRRAMSALLLAVVISIGMVMSLPSPVSAAQGYWWGSPVNPGFDRNTVILASGIASQVDLTSRGGPSTLSLKTQDENITVVLGPSWYISEQRMDIQNGDTLVIEGAKMMDRRGHLNLVASQVTNQRTGVIMRFRDEAGRPLWSSGRPQWRR